MMQDRIVVVLIEAEEAEGLMMTGEAVLFGL